MASSLSEYDRAPVVESHQDNFTPRPTYTYRHTTLKYSIWCSKAVQSDPSHLPAPLQQYYPLCEFHLASPPVVSCISSSACPLLRIAFCLPPQAPEVTVVQGVGASPNPPQGLKCYTDPITLNWGLNQTVSTQTP